MTKVVKKPAAKATKAEKEKFVIIDVDKVIKKYNEDNPDKKQLDRTELSALMEQKGMKTHTQTFSDWKRGKAHEIVGKLRFLMELGDCPLDHFVSETDTKPTSKKAKE